MFKRPDSGHILELNGLPPAPEPSRSEIIVRGFVVAIGTALAGAALFTCLTSCAVLRPSCCVPCTPTPTPGGPTATPEPTRTPRPPAPTRTPPPVVPTSTPVPPTPTGPVASQCTNCRATIRFDLTNFQLEPGLDYYADPYLTWLPVTPSSGVAYPTTPALELSIRGVTNELCQASPCGDTLGLVARWSANIQHDANTPNEHDHCGEGINYNHRLPVGPNRVFDVRVEWGPGFLDVLTPVGGWHAERGVHNPGFGVFSATIPNPPKGIGWSRSAWDLASHGGRAWLVGWERFEPLPLVSTCP